MDSCREGALVEFRVLGPVELWTGDRRRELGSPKENCALAALLLSAGRTVSADALAERIWGEQPPHQARSTLQAYISRLRRHLKDAGLDNPMMLTTSAHGYRLDVPESCIDAARFETLARRAEAIKSTDPRQAGELLREALELFRGEPLAGVPGDWAQAARASLQERRRAVVLKRIEIELRLGLHDQIIGELTELVTRRPADQAAVALLMTALYRAGRQAEALDVYRRTRERLRDLGLDPSRELRRLQESVLHSDPELGQEQPAATAARPEPVNMLDRDPAHFTGRDAELSALLQTIEGDLAEGFTSVYVVDGMPGVGKTTFCLHAAHLLRERLAGAALQLDLRGHDPHQRPMEPGEALIALLGLIGTPTAQLQRLDSLDACLSLWRRHTAQQPILLLLDDVQSADQVIPLLPVARGSVVLITSRSRLPELSEAHASSLDVMPAADSGALFARLVGTERVDEPQQLREVTDLCGDLPLAVVVAAGHLRSRPAWRVVDLAQRLDYARTKHDEHDQLARPVRIAFDFSYQELDEVQRTMFRRLGLHPGSRIGLHAAAALGGVSAAEADRTLDVLVSHNLLEEPARHRYRMHDLLRDYAVQRVLLDDEPPVRAEARHRMLVYYAAAANRAADILQPHGRRLVSRRYDGPELPDGSVTDFPHVATVAEAQAWFEEEYPNLLAVTLHALDRRSYGFAARLPRAMAQYLDREGRWKDAIEVHETALRAWYALGDTVGQAGALIDLAAAHWGAHNLDSAQVCAETALDIYLERADEAGQADAHLQLGRIHWRARRPAPADQHLRECVRLREQLQDRRGLAVATYHLGIVTLEFGVPEDSLCPFNTALQIARESGDQVSEINCLNNLGEAYRRTSRYGEALRHYEAALELTRQIGTPHNLAVIAHNIGAVHIRTGNFGAALESFRRALETFRQMDDAHNQVETLSGMSEACLELGRDEEAEDLLRNGQTLLERVDDPLAHATVYQALGSVQERRREYADALKAYRSALTHSRRAAAPADQARAHRRIGDMLAITRGRASAREHWRKALSLFEELKLPEAQELRELLQDG